MSQAKRTTIADIARLAGVSPGAVSFALNGRPGVSEQTRQRIIEIAEAHEWQPSSAARALVGSRAGVVGFAVNRPARTLGTEAFFTDLIAGVQSALAVHGMALQLVVVSSIAEEMATYRRWRSANQVDGVIVIDPRDDDPRLSLLPALPLPAVVIGSQESAGDPPSIWLDDEAAAHALFDYLAALASRNVSGETLVTDFSPAAATTATRTLLSRAARPTAIVYDNDVMAIAGLRVAQEMGVAVPSALSVASFDDSVVTGLVHPSITCLTRDTFALGEQAAVFLLERIGSEDPLPSRPGPTPALTIRESTSAPTR